MTDITVKHEPATNTARIEIRGADLSETRFRLRDPSTEKYLTKRGWTKTMSFLPGEAIRDGDMLTLTLDAELASKIAPGKNIALEEPRSGLQEILAWPKPGDVTIVEASSDDAAMFAAASAADLAILAETPPASDADTSNEPAEAEVVSAAPIVSLPADVPEDDKVSAPEPKALPLVSFEPTIMRDDVSDERKPDTPVFIGLAGDNDDRPSNWKPIAVAALACLLVGTGIGSVWSSYRHSSAIIEVRQAAAAQRDKLKSDFDSQLKQTKTSGATLAQLTKERDSARKALSDREQSLAALQTELDGAKAQIDSVTNAAGDKAKAQIAALDERLATLTSDVNDGKAEIATRQQKLTDAENRLAATSNKLAEAEKQTGEQSDQLQAAKQQLAERDTAVRDAQSKLSVANLQLDALKAIADKGTGQPPDSAAISEKVSQLSAELDKTTQALSDREQALAAANAKLKQAETRLADAGSQQAPTPVENGETAGRLKQERDLYASELKSLTASFTQLQSEKNSLANIISAQQQGKQGDSGLTTANIPAKSIWGATAIDQTGAVYTMQNQSSEKQAKDNVAALCRSKSGSACEALTSYSNACFSLARFEGEQPAVDNFAYFVNKDKRTAARTALERCESQGVNCTSRIVSCSPDPSKPASE